ncbi:MAG: DUF4838 domain-containing protein [Clostridiales bacterium]|nr:DUF4838 domain-containing protein [Clostridiales bacterium]
MFFIKDGKTEYKIVVKAPASERVEFAVKEWTDFILEATSCQMQTAEEGYTGKAVVLSYTDKGNEGYRIYTENGNYCVEGYCEKGLIYGVYGLLRRIVGLIFYTSDVYDIQKGDIEFKELDEERIPDIPSRAIGSVPIASSVLDEPLTKKEFRMGISSSGDNWGINSHSYFKILPPEKYKELHPDWYTQGDDGKNLCMSNLEMRGEFVTQLKRIILDHPKSKYFMLGHEDHEYGCECKGCLKAVECYDGLTGILELEFTNEVVKEINAWVKQEKIERELVFVTFAYVHSIAPPVKKVGNTYVPLFDFKLEKNIGVMIAPLFARGDKSYFDDENCHGRSTCHYDIYGYKMKDIFLGWRAIMDKLFVWSYCNDFCETLAPFNCWDGLEGNYRGYKDINVEYVFEEAAYNRIVPNFHYLRPYVLSKLMWNTNCSLESAIDEFIEGFYGANAAPYMRKYFDYLRDCCRKITSEKGRPMLYIRLDDFSDLTMPEYWSVDVLKEALRLHEEVVAHADEEYKARVEEEGFPIWFIMLARYHHRITDEERYEMAKRATAVMEKYDLLVRGEGIPFVYLQKIKTFVDSPYFRKVKKK